MAIKAIAHSYWRSIQRVDTGRTFVNIPDSVKDNVRALARIDVERNVITPETYLALIGEEYVAPEVTE